MARRALVVGSQTGALEGADRDAQRMADWLTGVGFAVDLRHRAAATRAGILQGYAGLIDAAGNGDSIVVYYSGHGCLEQIPQGVTSSGWFARTHYQSIVPVDYDASTALDFRGILAEELSVLLWKLTRRTRNVAVILDCCHAGLMSRDRRLRAKVFPHPAHVGVERCITALQAAETPASLAQALAAAGSDAVRAVACRQEQSAYEYTGADGQACGLFTDALLAALRDAGQEPASWRDIGERAAEYVLLRYPSQRPGVEGPAARRLFELVESAPRDDAPIVETVAEGWVFRRGRVFGVRVGDVVAVLPAHGDGELGRATVTRVGPASASLALPPWLVVPPNARGVRVEAVEPPRCVLVPIDCERRDEVIAAVARNPRLVAVADGHTTLLATVTVKGGALTLMNAEGQPMHDDLPMSAATCERLATNLRNMARAWALLELGGDDPSALEATWGVLIAGVATPLPRIGATLGPGDSLYIRLENTGERDLYAHVIDIGVSARVTVLTGTVWPSGVRVRPGETELLHRDRVTGAVSPTTFSWPATTPVAQGPRAEEFLCIATDVPVDVGALAQDGVRDRPGTPAAARLQAVLTQAFAGGTRKVNPFADAGGDELHVARIQFWASPEPVKRGT